MTSQRRIDGPTGARELILECQEMLAGTRRHFTPQAEYVAERLRYWKARADGNNARESGRHSTKAA